MGALCRRHHSGGALGPDLPTRLGPLESLDGNLTLPVQPRHRRKPSGGRHSQAWRIENKLHYTRDVTFREDASRIRKNPGVFARIRSFAYNILRFTPCLSA